MGMSRSCGAVFINIFSVTLSQKKIDETVDDIIWLFVRFFAVFRSECVAWLKAWDLWRQIHCSIPPQTISSFCLIFSATFTLQNVFSFFAAKSARISRMNCELTNPMMPRGFLFGSFSLLPGNIEFCGCRHHHNGIEPENQILFIFNHELGEKLKFIRPIYVLLALSGTRWWMLTGTCFLSSHSHFLQKAHRVFHSQLSDRYLPLARMDLNVIEMGKVAVKRNNSSRILFNWKISPQDMLWFRIFLIVYSNPLALSEKLFSQWKPQRSTDLASTEAFEYIYDTLQHTRNVICVKWKISWKERWNDLSKAIRRRRKGRKIWKQN